MQKIKKILEKVQKTIVFILWNIFVILVLFFILEFLSGIFISWYYSNENAINYEVFPNKIYVEEYLEEVNSIKGVYSPYIEYTTEPNFSGKFINTNGNGLRKTSNPCSNKDAIKIFVFGGSTTWGGFSDETTIPSLISKKFCEKNINVEVTNFGLSGYENTKEVIKLELELRNGNIPDIVIFYDGVNEVYSAFQNNKAGLPQNLENRRAEFNKKDKLNIGGFILYSDTMTVVRGISKKLFGNKEFDEGTEVEKLGSEIIDVYFSNLKIVKALEREYGFETYFFWQPVIYLDKSLTEGEKSVILGNVKPLYESTYPKMPRKIEALNFYDISDIFKNIEEPVYIDFAHLNTKGNEIVAEKIVEIIVEKENFK